jgi:hypothetical protein
MNITLQIISGGLEIPGTATQAVPIWSKRQMEAEVAAEP